MPVADRGRGARTWAEILRLPAETNETGGSDCGRWRNAKVAPEAVLCYKKLRARRLDPARIIRPKQSKVANDVNGSFRIATVDIDDRVEAAAATTAISRSLEPTIIAEEGDLLGVLCSVVKEPHPVRLCKTRLSRLNGVSSCPRPL